MAFQHLHNEDTIAAVSTAAGPGAIAIVRMSGPAALQITQQIFSPGRTYLQAQAKKTETTLESHLARHGFLVDRAGEPPAILSDRPAANAELVIDEVVVIPYLAPNSYTGEDLIEINCHGGQVITQSVLSLCLKHGARLAKPGEFTQRAFLAGRIDLTQAEAVLDLIQAKTERQRHMAVSAMTGHIGQKISLVRQQLVELLTAVVAGIDFPEEVGQLAADKVDTVLAPCLQQLTELVQTARSGRFLREGLYVAIVGRPNAGKSSLLNQLLKFERAIVTDIPGTTRDSIEELLDLNGIPIVLVDTAGIRHTEDQVEKIGIERSRQAIERANLVFFVTDLNEPWGLPETAILEAITDKPYILIGNKSDLLGEAASLSLPAKSAAIAASLLPASMPEAIAPSLGDSQTGPEPAPLPESLPNSWFGSQPMQSTTMSMPGSIPGSKSGSMPGSFSGSRSGSIPGSMPGSKPGTVTGSSPHSTPAHLPHSEPAHLPHSEPAHLPHSTPAHSPDSEPAQLPHSTQDRLPQSTPAHLPSSAGESLPNSSESDSAASNLSQSSSEPAPTFFPGRDINPAAIATCHVSSLTGAGFDSLTTALENWVFQGTPADGQILLNQRQAELCKKALRALQQAQGSQAEGMPEDCLATDLKSAIDALSEISGEAVSEEIIGQVFANFCIGK